MKDVDPKGRCARRKQRLHVRDNKRRGVVDQHSSQAEADEVVRPAVPGRTTGVHACQEGSVRVLCISDEVRPRVYEATGEPPEG